MNTQKGASPTREIDCRPVKLEDITNFDTAAAMASNGHPGSVNSRKGVFERVPLTGRLLFMDFLWNKRTAACCRPPA